jgi:alkylation response protein AidB-like acyl-CoA dehydrogenase
MNLALTDDQRMIGEAAAGFLADASAIAAVRKAAESADGHDAALWRGIGEMGWCGTAIAEAHGGLGLGPVELCLILEQMGRHLACSPFFASVALAGTLLAEAGTAAARKKYLPQIARGALRATATFEGAGVWARKDRKAAGGWRLKGRVQGVVDGAGAQLVLVATGQGVFAVAAGARGLKATAQRGWDGTRRLADLVLANVEAERVDDAAHRHGAYRAESLARLYLAAEQLGGAQQCLDLTVRYTGERRQFGRAIASFQAVKHRCAQMMVRVESLRSAVHGAAALAAGRPDADSLARECAGAKAWAAETYFHCAAEAIQLHGGVGFTWEFEPQLHFKRAQAGSHLLGTPDTLLGSESVLQAVEGKGRKTGLKNDLAESEGDRAFRRQVSEWMRKHLKGRFAGLQHRGGPGDEEFAPALRKEWEKELAAGGWTCVGWPKPWGKGLSIGQQVIFQEEYARAGGPGRISLLGEGLLGPALISFGSEDQKRRHLPGIVAGTTYWAQGYSEPNAGSDLSNVQTRAEPQPDGSWKVYGQKIWTSLAHESDWIFVLARSEPGTRGGKGLSFLLLPLKQPGITIRPIRQMTGNSEFNEVFFDGAVAAPDDVVGGPGNGWRVAMGLLEAERGVSTLGQQMRFAHELQLVVAAARRNGTLRDPLVRQRLARAWFGLRVLRYNALRMLAGGESTALPREALIFKYSWSNWHRDLGKLAADVLGPAADAVSDDPRIRPLQQLFFFSRADTIYAGTNEIQLNLIAERGLGMPKEPRGEK